MLKLLEQKRPRLRSGGGPAGLRGQAPKFAKYAQILKNSVATKKRNRRLSLMKDLAAVEEAKAWALK